RLALHTTSPVEELALGRELDAVGAQVLREHERERVRNDRVRDADALDASERQFERDLPVAETRIEQRVEAEPERRGQHGVDAGLLEARPLEVRDDDVAAAVELRVEERVAEGERHLVAKLGMANRVAVDQDVCHAEDSNERRSSRVGARTPAASSASRIS